MAAGPFAFLRGTFYRWAQTWAGLCKEAAAAPVVLAVGDLHLENFGTWRDEEGRLVWGVNDFDESCYLPYTSDLIRLATSARLAIEASHLRLDSAAASEAILAGYTAGLKAGGQAFILAESHAWLREIALGTLRDPIPFWAKMDALPDVKEPVSESARVALEHALPRPGQAYRVKARVAGVGSLGHPRFVALADYCGGRIAREAKALVPSSALWARTPDAAPEIFYQAVVDRAIRSPDPFVRLQGHWIVRRLAPDCARVELEALPDPRTEARLLHAMGWESANVHLGSRTAARPILQDLRKREKGWLDRAATTMARAIHSDWERWAEPQPKR